ncbi:MAG: hypothetical protein U0401_19385 [Anaerolineae bacterium]
MSEGLGDVAGRVITARETSANGGVIDVPIRSQFQHYSGKVYLPCFVVPDNRGSWREVGYEVDILSRVDWDAVDLSPMSDLELNPFKIQDSHVSLNLDHVTAIEPLRAISTADMRLDLAFMTRQLLDAVPNPWMAYQYIEETITRLKGKQYTEAEIKRDLGFVIEELKKRIAAEVERLTKQVFDSLLAGGELRFYLIAGAAGSAIPDRIKAKAGARKLTTALGDPLQRTLFDYYPEEDFNHTEQAVALYLDQQEDILEWWFRNNVNANSYSIQGWRRHRVYPDFIALRQGPPVVYVLETKGVHLKNLDTDYKKQLFELCNEQSQPTPWSEILQDFSDHKLTFQIVFDDEWQRVLNALLAPAKQ